MACALFHPRLSPWLPCRVEGKSRGNSAFFSETQTSMLGFRGTCIRQSSFLEHRKAQQIRPLARPLASTADVVFSSGSAHASVLLAVEELEDGSRLFKYGARSEQEQLQRAEADLGDGEVNWTFASNGATAAEIESEGEEWPLGNSREDGEGALASEEAQFIEEGGPFVADECILTEEDDDPVEKCPLRLESAASCIPHPSRAQRGGEDAHFILDNWVGVADGISGWAELGVNSGLYSRELMWNCKEVIRSGEVGLDPKAVIEESHSRTDLQGSCTATVAVLHGQVLRVANIGDSGFALIRAGQLLTRSRSMQHSFNMPFQIGTSGGDDPSVTEVYEVEVQPKDILLLGTDGLFDNVFEDVIAGTLTQAFCEGKGPEVASKQLALVAQKQSSMASGSTPFRENALAAGQQHDGGKKDDITVLVAYIE